MQDALAEAAGQQMTIGFVPTMGALHEGHLSLIYEAKSRYDVVVCSIFINPTQFSSDEDFVNYPVTPQEDEALLERAGCDILYRPDVGDIYPDGPDAMETFGMGPLEHILEGAHRPGHFKGVGQVVSRLLALVQPDGLIMGQKDYQQCAIVARLLKETDQEGIALHVCPTVREADGLAMSSRNRRLTPGMRMKAATIYQCLVSIESKAGHSPYEIVHKECLDLLRDRGFEVEYVALADAEELTLLDEYDLNRKMVALVAVKLGLVRLIDNLVLHPRP
jgi:pantoate--beta-alanine ligase